MPTFCPGAAHHLYGSDAAAHPAQRQPGLYPRFRQTVRPGDGHFCRPIIMWFVDRTRIIVFLLHFPVCDP